MSALEKAWLDLQAFFKKWDLSKDEIIKVLQINEEIYESWAQSGAMSISPRIVARCAECWALHEALLVHFPEDQAYGWVKRPNSAELFAGKTAIQTICEGLEKDPKIIRKILEYLYAEAT